MSELEIQIAALRRENREIKELLSILVGEKSLLKLPEAANYLSIDPARLRVMCKEGLDGAVLMGTGKKNLHYHIDVIKAKKDLENRGIGIKKVRNHKTT
jgi:hypothetical protein